MRHCQGDINVIVPAILLEIAVFLGADMCWWEPFVVAKEGMQDKCFSNPGCKQVNAAEPGN